MGKIIEPVKVFYFFQTLLDEHDGISSKQLKMAMSRSMLQSRVRAAQRQNASPSEEGEPQT